MTQVYNLPITRQFTDTGKVAVGYQKFFYDTDTTIKRSIFADKELTTPLTNPVLSDANGYYPQIFLLGTGDDYKVVVATDTDTDPPTSPIWTADPIDVDANDINEFAVRPAQHWGTTTGTGTAYKITPNPAISSYTDDLLFSLEIHTDNTAAATLAVADLNTPGSFLSALDIKKYDGAGGKVDIEIKDLLGNQTYIYRIDSVDAVVLNPEKPFFDSRNLSAATTAIKGVSVLVFPKQITVSNGADTDHDIDFTAGNFQFNDNSGQAATSALTKLLDSTFALGNNVGGMAEGISLPTNGTVHLFALSTIDGSLTDYIGDTNVNATNALADSVAVANSLTKFTRIASLCTDGSSDIRNGSYRFRKNGGYNFIYNTFIANFSGASGTTKTNRTLTIPAGIQVFPSFHLNTTGTVNTLIFSSNQSDVAPTIDNAIMTDSGSKDPTIYNDFLSNNSSQISTHSSSNGTVNFYTHGWNDDVLD